MSGSPMKASNSQLVQAYGELNSCRLVAERFGMCAQSVHERLKRIGVVRKQNVFTRDDEERLIREYEDYVNSGRLEELADSMGRTPQFLCRKASRLGITNKARSKAHMSAGMSARAKDWHARNPHPRGFQGKSHSHSAREAISLNSRRYWDSRTQEQRDEHLMKSLKSRKSPPAPRPNASWKGGWREVGGRNIYFRSRWEANYGRYLQWLKEKGEISDWWHEPETFWFDGVKRGCVSYLPDFLVEESTGERVYYEVKGWMDQRSKTKLRRMKKYHPSVKLILIDAAQYRSLERKLRGLVPGWEWGSKV